MIIKGSKAPDFTLRDQNGKTVKLSSLQGKKVLLSFRPLAWTPVWTDQMHSLEENISKFKDLNAVDINGAIKTISGTARSMGIEITG